MFSYLKVKEHPKLFLAMTGLSYAEFHQLLPHFQYAWNQYVTQHMLIETIANGNMALGEQNQPWSLLRTSCSSSCMMSKSILCKKSSLLNLVWCKVRQMNGFRY